MSIWPPRKPILHRSKGHWHMQIFTDISSLLASRAALAPGLNRRLQNPGAGADATRLAGAITRFGSPVSTTIWVLLFILVSQIVTAGEMLVDLGPGIKRGNVSEPGPVENHAAGIAADIYETRLGINSAGDPGQTDFDDQQVTITFTPSRAGMKMVAFSDDGVTVTIRDVTSGSVGSGGSGGAYSTGTASSTGGSTEVLGYKGTGQALPDLNQSLKDIDYTFETGHTYEITVDYINTYYTGDGDVDGAQLIAYGPEAGTCIIDRIIVKDSDPEDRGPAVLRPGSGVSLKAIPGPAEMTFPAGEPHWQVAKKPTGSQLADPAGGSDIADISPDVLGEYVIKATCGSSSATFRITVEPAPTIDLDVDSNNNGAIAGSNVDSEDLYEATGPGLVLPIDKMATAKLSCPYTTGTLTLSSSFAETAFFIGTAGQVSWNLAEQSPPTSFSLTANTLDVFSQIKPLALGEPMRSGSVTATHTALNGTVTSDTVSVTLVRRVSQSPQNNQAAAWNGGYEFSAAGELAKSLTTGNGYEWTLYGDLAAFPSQFATRPGHIQSSWNIFKNLGKKGMLVVPSHGSTGGVLVTAGKTEAQLRTYIGLPAVNVSGIDDLPSGVHISPRKLYERLGNGFLLTVDSSWVAANWQSDRNSARSIGFFMACRSAETPAGRSSVIDSAGGAEAFGYTWCCMPSDHAHDIDLLLGQRMNSASHRPAGIAIEASGFTDRISACDIWDPATEQRHEFKRAAGGNYWTTLNPAPFVKADAWAFSTLTGNRIGYAGVHLDTQRDTSFPPQAVLSKTAGNGQIINGPYDVQPSWGIGCEYLLRPGQSITLFLDNAQVVGDGSTKKLKLAAPITWNAGN